VVTQYVCVVAVMQLLQLCNGCSYAVVAVMQLLQLCSCCSYAVVAVMQLCIYAVVAVTPYGLLGI